MTDHGQSGHAARGKVGMDCKDIHGNAQKKGTDEICKEGEKKLLSLWKDVPHSPSSADGPGTQVSKISGNS